MAEDNDPIESSVLARIQVGQPDGGPVEGAVQQEIRTASFYHVLGYSLVDLVYVLLIVWLQRWLVCLERDSQQGKDKVPGIRGLEPNLQTIGRTEVLGIVK